MKTKQLIALQRNKVYTSLTSPAEFNDDRRKKLLTITEELRRFGHYLSAESLMYLSDEDLEGIYKDILPALSKKYYPTESWNPLYPGFPQQVIDATTDKLWEDQHKIYDTLDYDKFLKDNMWYLDGEIEETENPVILERMTETDLLQIFTDIVSSGNSLAPDTREELMWFLAHRPEHKLPDKIPFKETLCLVMTYRPEYKPATINDILRFGMYAMGADPELPHVAKQVNASAWGKQKIDNPVWRKLNTLTRATRRRLMETIEEFLKTSSLKNAVVDAKRFYGVWVLLSERIHPREYTKTYPKAAQFFTELKSNAKKYKSWYSTLQDKYNSGEDVVDITKFISDRPGELVRRLDSLLRRSITAGKEGEIMDIFLDTDGMSNKTLIELLAYYEKRGQTTTRLVSLKGTSTKTSLTPLEPLRPELIELVRECIERKILINIKNSITEKDFEGKKVYIDPEIKNMPIPKGMRDQVFCIPTGTRIKIAEDKKIIRLFIHWIQKGTPEDLDLHAYFYKDEQTIPRNIGWNTGLKSDCACHSGDVLNREGDCSEFIDVDIQKAIDAGWKYVIADVQNYKGRGLDTLDNWMGYATLDQMYPTKDWVPRGVDFSQKVEGVTDSGMAAWIFDLENREVILLGVGLDTIPVSPGRLNQDLIKFFANPLKFSTYDVLLENYKDRGAEIVDPEDSESLADPETIVITAKEIMSDYTKVLKILG